GTYHRSGRYGRYRRAGRRVCRASGRVVPARAHGVGVLGAANTPRSIMAFSEKQQDVLRKPAFGHVATLGPSGEPQTSPVWIDWDGEFLKFSQTSTRQKLKNLERDRRVAVSATDPDDPY